MRWMKFALPLLVAAAFFAALIAGVQRFGLPENTSTVQTFDREWEYTTDTGEQGVLPLPNVLFLPRKTTAVRFVSTLPEQIGEAFALQFVTIEQTVEVWIDGILRYQHGAPPDAKDFVYRSGQHVNQVLLSPEDSGKEITLIYSSSPLFLLELGILREIRIGTVSDLNLDLFYQSTPIIAISFFAILTVLLSFIMLVLYRDLPFRNNLCMLFLTLVTVLFLNSENLAFWPMFHYSFTLPALIDWTFFYLDPIIQFASWFSLFVLDWRLRGAARWIPPAFGLLYAGATALAVAGLINFNITRPIFMICGFFFTIFWARSSLLKRPGKFTGISLAVLTLLGGYYLDYMKYLLMIMPLSPQWSVFLQENLPPQFLTCIALSIFSVQVLMETMEQVARHKSDIKVEAATSQLLMEYSRQQYESIVQRDMSLRSIKHDMQFYFRTVAAMISGGQIEEASRYLADLGNTVATLKVSAWCADYVANITIGWYADQFQQQGIPFTVTAAIPAIREDVHADISCILSNALQNAMEGCAECPDAFVRLTAKPRKNNLILRIENSCSDAQTSRRTFSTTKSGDGHGVGMISMKAAAKRQNGYFLATAENNVFRVDVVLCNIFAPPCSPCENRTEKRYKTDTKPAPFQVPADVCHCFFALG